MVKKIVDPDLVDLRKRGALCRLPTQFVEGTLAELRLWSEVTVTPDGCWDYPRSRNVAGYGTIGFNRRTVYAHRLAWQLVNGPIPRGMCVLHACDRPSCCRPSHLWLGTRANNNMDKILKGREGAVAYGELSHMAKLTANQVIEARGLQARGYYSHEIVEKLELKCGASALRHALNGRTWKHIGGLT